MGSKISINLQIGNFKKFAAFFLTACLILGLVPQNLYVNAESGSSSFIAEKVDASLLQPGDQVIIVYNLANKAVSTTEITKNQKVTLAPADVTIKETATRHVITEMSSDTALFTVQSAGEKDIYLHSDKGYLTSAASGNSLSFSTVANDYSVCRFVENMFVYFPNVFSTSGDTTYKNFYLECYNNNFTTYSKTKNSNVDLYTFSFYRVGDSNPGEPILEDNLYRLPVFETSDVHGYIVNKTETGYQYMLAYISDKVHDVRGFNAQYNKDLAILLDGGDIYQGNPASNLMEGQSLAAAYAMMDYDAVTIGNHEFDWGIENTVDDSDNTMMDYDFNGISGANTIPVVCSNMYQNGANVSFADPYIILNKKATDKLGNVISVKVAVIGFAGEYSKSIRTSRFIDKGYSIKLEYDKVNELAASLEASGKCDATILLAHEDAAELAEKIGEETKIDLVLGGHTHSSMCGKTSWGLNYIEPANAGKAYTYSELSFSKEGDLVTFENVLNPQAVSTTSVPAKLYNESTNYEELDQYLCELTDNVLGEFDEYLNEKIGYITVPIKRYEYIDGSGDRSTTCGNFMASIYQRIGNADVGFVNGGGMRVDINLDSDGKHDITLGDIYEEYPFDNQIYVYNITYEEFMEVLKYSLTNSGKTLLSNMVGIDCYYTGQTVNGLVTADGETIYANGKWKDGWKEKKIKIAVTDYVATNNRISNTGMENPLCAWNDTDKQTISEMVDNEGAYAVLKKEAADNNGLITIDKNAHYINSEFAGSIEEDDPNGKTDDGQSEIDPDKEKQKENESDIVTPETPDKDKTNKNGTDKGKSDKNETDKDADSENPSSDKSKTSNTSSAKVKTLKKKAQSVLDKGIKVKEVKGKLKISWSKVKVADGYDVYVQYSNKKFKKAVKTIKKNGTTTFTLKKLNGKKLNLKKSFKVYVDANKKIDGKKVELAKSKVCFVAGSKNKIYTNVKSIRLTKNKYSIKVGKTVKIKAKVTLADKKKKQLPKKLAAKFRYKSTNTGIAKVSSSGKIKGIKKGTCTIYVYSINGLVKKIKVTVK